ncbi:U5 small nuclear ribonucleoprotein [Porphyridium purpureum]|uniref:U5 small nuclear ribonucleoprotein 200 kDa helicase n=1 Tax=Porphyridium purpureum TaxID=35688 RepID=A0A5J4YG71_PORPP|nr:U5 small nuclear ribonucleoprotein [Porphyridium purpureum]|eukprot:POR8637..scf237_24
MPKGTFRVKKKDCEEVHVPAIPSRKMGGAPKLVSVEDMSPLAREAFTGTTHLNRVQSEVYPCAFESDENMLVCAPTGAGKTNVAMMCILRLVVREPLENLRVVYIAPMKALVSEVVGNLSRRLAYLGISVAELTGDASLSRRQMDSTHVVVSTPEKWDILTRKTAQGVRSLAYNVRLMIIDEIHLLHDERGPVLESIVARVRRCVTQGSMNTRVVGLSATLPNVEDVGAFLGCSQESSSRQKSVFHFDASFRPCPLQSVYVGVQKGSGWKRLQSMNEIAYEHVRAQLEASASAQVIVFVHSRKETATTAKYFRESAREQGVLDRLFMVPNSASQNIVHSELGTVRNAVLRDVMGSSGIGIHHAGLAAADRALTEDLFADGHLRVLVSTATLAWGVNLPAHAIVIKGTKVYSPEKGTWVELSPIDVMQMMGRAGRPQFDSFGEGIIITSASQMQFYLSLLNQQLPIESQLMTRFTDSLNAEIAMRNVSSIADGAEWLGYTYYGTRMMRSPSLYGVSCIAHSEQDAITIQSRRRMDLIHSACIKLERAGLVRYDKKKLVVGPTELGRIASEYYISSASMAAYVQHLKADISVMDLLRVFSMSAEFRSVRVRQEEKMELKRLAERVPYPLVDGGNAMLADSGSAILAGQTVDGSNDKVVVLLQAYISRLTLDGLVLAADMVYVTQSAARIARALFDLVLRRRWAQAAEKCLSLYKMIKWRQWNVESPLRQFGSAGAVGPDHHRIAVPTELLRKLERKDMELERFFDLDEKQLGDFLRNAKLGTLTFRLLHHLPYLDVTARVRPVTPHLLDVELNLVPDFVFDGARFHAAGQAFWVWVEDADADMILFAKQVFIRAALAHEEHALKFTVALQQQSQQQQSVRSVDPYYFVHVMSDSWISRDVVVPLSLRSLELPQVFELRTKVHADPSATRGEQSTLRATTELAAIKSQIEGELESSGHDVVPSGGIYQWRKNVLEAVLMHVQTNLAISRLNVIQSRVFDSIFCTDANCFVSMPGGSGRGVLIDLCIARAFWSKPRAVCVVLAAYGDTAAVRRREQLASGIARLLGIAANVHVLTGDLSSDFKLLESGDSGAILVVTPTAWDMLSRRWKQRKSIVRIDLFIADHVELVGSFDLDGSASGSGLSQRRLGVTLEVVLSRMRYIRNSHKKAAFRMVAFADIMSNARDIIDWLGVEKEHGYCFPMDARVIPLDTHVQSLDLDPNSESGTGGGAGMRRQFAMAVCRILTQLTKDHSTPLLVVVNSRGNAISIAAELLVSLPAHSVTSEMNTALPETAGFSEIKSASLRECIEHGGVAFLHEGVSQADRVAVLQLYVKGALRVMVLTPAMLQHDGRLRANVVVLAGTTREESRMGCNIAQQYAFSEVCLMLGRAGVSVPTPEPAVDHEWPRSGSSRGAAVAYVLTEPAYKEYYVRCLGEALPVESGLDQGPDLADHMNAEIVSRVIETQQDMIDYLTWTLYYRRLMQNPNYYGLNLLSTLNKQGNKNAVAATRQRISEHLSQLVEDCVTELRETKCISVEGQFGASTVVDNGSDLIASPGEAAPGTIGDGIVILGALNLGMIASHYYVQHATITVFSQSLSEKTTRLRSLMEILAAASEFDDLPVRSDEEAALRMLATHTDVLAAGRHDLLDRVADPHVKALVLMHSHLRRALGTNIPPQLREDQTRVVRTMVRLLYALVDVASSSGWLKTTLAAMELCQAVVQACWPARIANQQSQPRLSPLQQLPHMDASLLARLASRNVHGVFDLLDMEEEERTAAFKGLSRAQIADIARFCNAFPNVDFSCAVHPARLALPGAGHDIADDSGVVTVRVRLERDPDDDDDDHSDHEEEAGPAAAERGEARGQEAQELDGIERESLPRLQMPRPLPAEAVSKTTPSPGESGARAAHAPLYPGRKDEGWWVCVGDVRQNRILALKRAVIDERQPVELELRFREDDWFSEETANQANVRTSAHHENTVAQAPRQLGVFLISDCYLGCDQEETLHYCTSPSS